MWGKIYLPSGIKIIEHKVCKTFSAVTITTLAIDVGNQFILHPNNKNI